MNNMKKALALVMSLALAASTFVVGAAYDDVPDSHENRIAINLLGDLGVMVGDAGTNDFRPEGTLKRSEAAAIVYRLRTGKTNADSYVGTTGFSDVAKEHWASGYINYCVEQGAIAGYPDGTYKPDQEVTYAEFIKMVVCALNLQKVETTTYIDMNTGVLVSEDKITTNYPNGYIKLASDQQINEGIDYLEPNDKINRAEVAQGAYNAIFESYYKLDPKDADYVRDKDNKYQHLAEQVFKLVKHTGVVRAYEDYTAGEGTQEDNKFYLDVHIDGGEGTSDSYEYADFDASWLGQKVYVWEKTRLQTSATEDKVVAVVAHEDNKVTTVNTVDVKIDGSDFYYTDAEGKKQTIKGDELGNTRLIINGELYKGITVTAKTLLEKVAEQRIPMDLTFIDNDGSPKSPSYISVKLYAETEITSVTEDALYVKNIEDTYKFNEMEDDGTSNHVARQVYMDLLAEANDDGSDDLDVYKMRSGSIDLKNDDDTVNQKIKYYDGIAKGDKVMIYADANGNYDIRKIEEVEGDITLMSGKKYKIGDQELYIVAGDAMKNLMDTNVNSGVLAYVDPFTGYIIYAEEGTGNVSDYYYVHMVQKQYATSSDYQLLAYDYEGNKVTLTFKNSDAQKEVLGEDGLDVDLSKVNNGYLLADKIAILDVNSKGVITGWRTNNTEGLTAGVSYNKDDEYNTKTGYVNIANKRVEIKPSTVVFGVQYEQVETAPGSGVYVDNREKIDEVKTYVGSFPKATTNLPGGTNADGTVNGVDYYLRKNDDDLKVALVRGKTKGGNTEFTNVTGYVLSETFEYTDKDNKKGFATYEIATKGEIKEYQTEVVDDADLVDTLLKQQANGGYKHCMIKFDLTTDGKIVYSDSTDIEVMDTATGIGDFEKIVEDAQNKASILRLARAITPITNDPMTDFSSIYPGLDALDEDEIYYGIVVEGKDEKFMQLVNLNGASIIVDYADDVKVYNIEEDDFDSAKVGTTGNITDSNSGYTTYAAVRIVDGDDVNDARITEVYAYTVEDTTFQRVYENQKAANTSAANVVNDFTVYGGTASTTPETPESSASEQLIKDFGTSTIAKDLNATTAYQLGEDMVVPKGCTLAIDADNGATVKIGNETLKYQVAAATLAADSIALSTDSGANAVASAGQGVVGLYIKGADAFVFNNTDDLTVTIPMVLTDAEGKEEKFDLTVTVSKSAQADIDTAKAKELLATVTSLDEVAASTYTGMGDGDKILTKGNGITYAIASGNEAGLLKDNSGDVEKNGDGVAPASDTTVMIKVTATVGSKSESKELPLVIKAKTSTEAAAEQEANAFLNTGIKVMNTATTPTLIATGKTYSNVLSAADATAAAACFTLSSNVPTEANQQAAYDDMMAAWSALSTEAKEAVAKRATTHGGTVTGVETFLKSISAAITVQAADEVNQAAVTAFMANPLPQSGKDYGDFFAADPSSNAIAAANLLATGGTFSAGDVDDMRKAFEDLKSAWNMLSPEQKALVYADTNNDSKVGDTASSVTTAFIDVETKLTNRETGLKLNAAFDVIEGVFTGESSDINAATIVDVNTDGTAVANTTGTVTVQGDATAIIGTDGLVLDFGAATYVDVTLGDITAAKGAATSAEVDETGKIVTIKAASGTNMSTTTITIPVTYGTKTVNVVLTFSGNLN